MSPTYVAFHAWLSKNRKRIAAATDRTVIYSGMDSGNVPLYRRLEEHERFLKHDYGRDPKWEPIKKVLLEIDVDWRNYQAGAELPKGVFALKNLWDFAFDVKRISGAVTNGESQQIWKNLSAWYVKNATGKMYIFEGDTLKKYPDMLLAEIPVLLKNKNVKLTAATQAKMIKLIPTSKAAWEAYRKDTAAGREAGR